jgi:hypothetical protein
MTYADDWVIVTSSKAPIRSETRIKEVANSVTRWASDNGFKISPEKRKTMLIHRRRPRNETRFKLRVLIGTEKVELVKKHRILGLTFHERLNWKEHIQDVRRKGKGDMEAQSTKKLVSHFMGTRKHSCGSTK